ncbi:MAG: DUF302 domain-containing protein [Desulfococcaceae bacterium]
MKMFLRTASLWTAFFLLLVAPPALADDGLVTVKSAHDVKTTADRLEKALKEKGMTVFIRIDHGANAAKMDLELRPTELLIFGSPKLGAPVMNCAQSAGIDLTQKALIWEDSQGEIWLTYNDPEYLVKRHDIDGCQKQIDTFKNALANFAKAVTAP